MEWAIEVCTNTGKTVAASMCIGPEGDLHGVSAEECAVRMAKAGARVGKNVYSTSHAHTQTHTITNGSILIKMPIFNLLFLVGVNCHFDPFVSLDALKVMKRGLYDADLLDTTYLMCQPLGYFTPDAGKQGFIDLPEFPFGLEPRICTRWDMHRYAKEAWELGVR